MLMHTVDLMLIRIMGVSVWYTFNFVFDETFGNFLEMLYASNIPLYLWGLIFSAAIGIPTIGYYVFVYSQKLSEKKPYSISHKKVAYIFSGTLLGMLVFSLVVFPLHDRVSQEHLERTLPWKTAFSSMHRAFISFPAGIEEPESEESFLSTLSSKDYTLEKKPNIFLFIVETFRKDTASDPLVSPNLSLFQSENISFDHSFSSANATQISWFSIFYSRFPYYWKHIGMDNWTSGSPGLQILKKLGYSIHVYTSARLNYYQMDEIIFGKGRKMIDEFHFYEHDHKVPAYESDALVMHKLSEDIAKEENQEGRVHIIFLDSTHFEYSWPEDQSPFTPYSKSVNYVTLACLKQNIEKVKNGYKNTVHHLDGLFGVFYQTLKKQKQFQDSLVVLTGDHAEEHFEPNNIFHASALTNAQISVPILFKLGANLTRPSKDRLTSHVDIFPTIIDHLVHDEYDFNGRSILKPEKLPYTISAKYNASRTPEEFCIHNGEYKLILRFPDPIHIFSNRDLEIISIRDSKEQLMDSKVDLKTVFGQALDTLFSREEISRK